LGDGITSPKKRPCSTLDQPGPRSSCVSFAPSTRSTRDLTLSIGRRGAQKSCRAIWNTVKWLTLAKAQMDHGRWGFWPRVSCAARCWLCVAGGSPAPTCERECWLQNVPREDRWKELVGLYLSPEHCDHPDTGCPVAALPPEIARAKLSVRFRFGRRCGEIVKSAALRQKQRSVRPDFPESPAGG